MKDLVLLFFVSTGAYVFWRRIAFPVIEAVLFGFAYTIFIILAEGRESWKWIPLMILVLPFVGAYKRLFGEWRYTPLFKICRI